MKPFNLTFAATNDLQDIALFTQRRWKDEQRNIYLKQFDDSFWLLAKTQISENHAIKSERDTENFLWVAASFFISKQAVNTLGSAVFFIRAWMLIR